VEDLGSILCCCREQGFGSRWGIVIAALLASMRVLWGLFRF